MTNLDRVSVGDLAIVAWETLSEWSQATFGLDSQRGPIGPLKHLAKEAMEAIAKPSDRSEYADCLILVFDAARRSGMSLLDLLIEVNKKIEINRQREWPKPTVHDEPIEHKK